MGLGNLKNRIIDFYFMGLNVLPVDIKVLHVCTMPEETSGALELGLQVVASHHVEAENFCLVFYQSSKCSELLRHHLSSSGLRQL